MLTVATFNMSRAMKLNWRRNTAPRKHFLSQMKRLALIQMEPMRTLIFVIVALVARILLIATVSKLVQKRRIALTVPITWKLHFILRWVNCFSFLLNYLKLLQIEVPEPSACFSTKVSKTKLNVLKYQHYCHYMCVLFINRRDSVTSRELDQGSIFVAYVSTQPIRLLWRFYKTIWYEVLFIKVNYLRKKILKSIF